MVPAFFLDLYISSRTPVEHPRTINHPKSLFRSPAYLAVILQPRAETLGFNFPLKPDVVANLEEVSVPFVFKAHFFFSLQSGASKKKNRTDF